jgi:hypothetical protein
VISFAKCHSGCRLYLICAFLFNTVIIFDQVGFAAIYPANQDVRWCCVILPFRSHFFRERLWLSYRQAKETGTQSAGSSGLAWFDVFKHLHELSIFIVTPDPALSNKARLKSSTAKLHNQEQLGLEMSIVTQEIFFDTLLLTSIFFHFRDALLTGGLNRSSMADCSR